MEVAKKPPPLSEAPLVKVKPLSAAPSTIYAHRAVFAPSMIVTAGPFTL